MISVVGGVVMVMKVLKIEGNFVGRNRGSNLVAFAWKQYGPLAQPWT